MFEQEFYLIDVVINGEEASVQRHLWSQKMSEVYLWVASYYSGDVFVVIVKIPIILLPLKQFPCILIQSISLRPLWNLYHLIKAHNNINNDILFLESLLLALDDAFAHV